MQSDFSISYTLAASLGLWLSHFVFIAVLVGMHSLELRFSWVLLERDLGSITSMP